jgi:type IV secretion system protein VirB2
MSRENARSIRGLGRWYSVRLERTLQAATGAVTSPAFIRTAAVAGVLLVSVAPAMAANSGGDPMPWEGPMDQFLAFFTGPFVRIAAIIAIVLLGVGMAFSENGTGMRKMVTAFFGIALAFGAATWGLSFFGFSGGAAIDGQVLDATVPTTAQVIAQEAERFDAQQQQEQQDAARD